MPCSNPWVALEAVAAATELPTPKNKGGAIERLFLNEQADLATQKILPLFHLPVSYADSVSVREWVLRRDGSLELDHAWLEAAK